MKNNVFLINGKFKNCLDAIHWFKSFFGNRTVREMQIILTIINEANIQFYKISKGEINYVRK